jgi:hypothetical protein
VPPLPALHHDQPALRSDLEFDPVTGAIFCYGIDEYSLAVEHRYPVCAAVCRLLIYAKKRLGILSSDAGFGGN